MTETLDPELEAALAELRRAFVAAPPSSEVTMPLRKDRTGRLHRRAKVRIESDVEIKAGDERGSL